MLLDVYVITIVFSTENILKLIMKDEKLEQRNQVSSNKFIRNIHLKSHERKNKCTK